MRAFEAALGCMWAMEEKALDGLLAIARRENETTPEMLEAYRAKNMERSERARARDGVAIIDVIGPTFKRANLFVSMSGATSYEIIRADFQAALDDPKIKSIMLNIDSPGGEANGMAELASAIYAARGIKPVTAYVGGMGASAGYWLASAADRIVVDSTALLGSIGVQWAVRGDPAENPRDGKTYRLVSSQSPLKNASPDTEQGISHLQGVVDAMAQVFVETVARNRGVATETVLNDFGKGGILVGNDAVKAGLADALGSFESVLAELSVNRPKSGGGKSTRKGTSMSETNDTQEAAATAAPAPAVVDVTAEINKSVTAALAGERSRVSGLHAIASAHGIDPATLNAAIGDGSSVEAFALAVAAKVAASRDAKVAALKQDEAAAATVNPSAGSEDDSNVDRLAAAIAAA